MSIETIQELFLRTANFLATHQHELANIETKKQIREGESAVLAADLQSERMIVPELCKFWPGTPVLCEEAENSRLAELVRGIELLSYNDDVVNLPKRQISVDGLDGSALYANGEFDLVAISAGLISNGIPAAGIIMMLDEKVSYYTGLSQSPLLYKGGQAYNFWRLSSRPLKESLIGVDDNKAVGQRFRRLVISRLMSSDRTRYPLNVPSVAGALKVLQGKLAAYVTSNARHWDIAGTAALISNAGMVVRCLDASPVPWNQVRMPPVVFARDEQTFAYVNELAQDYLKSLATDPDDWQG